MNLLLNPFKLKKIYISVCQAEQLRPRGKCGSGVRLRSLCEESYNKGLVFFFLLSTLFC